LGGACFLKKEMKIIGYHGTHLISARSIEKEGYRLSNKDNWFGAGVYFFKDFFTLCNGYYEAENWARNVKKIVDVAVLRSTIETDSIFDLVTNIEDRRDFDELKAGALEAHRRAGFQDKEFNLNTVFIKLEGSYQVMIALVDGSRFEGFHDYVVRRPQVQVCVKEKSCILETAIV